MGRRSDIKVLPSQDALRGMFDYDPETGSIKWRPREPVTRGDRCFNAKAAGKSAGTVNASGYSIIGIRGSYCYTHRIIWKMMTGDDPQDQVDHRDGNKLNYLAKPAAC